MTCPDCRTDSTVTRVASTRATTARACRASSARSARGAAGSASSSASPRASSSSWARPSPRGRRRRPGTRTASATTATCGRSSPRAASPATGPTGTAARPACGSTARSWRRERSAPARWRSSPARPSAAGSWRASCTRTRRAACRSPKSGRARLPLRSRSRRCGAGSRRARSGSRTGPTSRPARPEPPPTRDPGWARSPVDAFVLAQIERAGLRPSPEASRAELLRRLSFDLTGLPPTPAEVAPSSATRSHEAYERLVDRLLASPHFGERMAVFWLDLVRYADSVGYHSDNARAMWRYRDWVIDAFNDNLPFDRFTAEQLAGDLLPDADATSRRSPPATTGCCRRPRRAARSPRSTAPIYARRPRAQRLERLAGRDDRLRAVPRPQVRPLPGARLLRASRPSSRTSKEEPVGRRKPDSLPDAGQKPTLDALDARSPGRAEAALEARRPTPEWEAGVAGPPAARASRRSSRSRPSGERHAH